MVIGEHVKNDPSSNDDKVEDEDENPWAIFGKLNHGEGYGLRSLVDLASASAAAFLASRAFFR